MSIERLVGVYVTDEDAYQTYREKMFPILKSYGGDFGYDFKIAEVLKSEVSSPMNRVFTIYFKDEDSMDSFFNDESYLKIKLQYFKPSVSHVTEISKYVK